MNIIFISLLMMIVITDGLNQDFMLSSSSLSSSTSNNGKIVEKSSNAVNSKVSRLRLLFLSDFNQNSIPAQNVDSCWASSQTIKITSKCPCNQINCNAPAEARRRLISLSCMQVCCGNRYKKASIRSLSEAQLKELSRFSLEDNCRRSNHSNSYVIAKIYDKLSDKSICTGILVHNQFLLTTAICVSNVKSNEIHIRFTSDEKHDVREIIVHPNFYKSMETLQHNIAILMLEDPIPNHDLPCIKKHNIDNSYCHVFSWGSTKSSENSMKMNNMEVLSKGECFTQHLINGKHHEKYVRKGDNNICVGNKYHYELDINLSGSPLTCHQIQRNEPTILKGLLTWSTKVNFYPHLFTDVTQFTTWIETTVNEKTLNSI